MRGHQYEFNIRCTPQFIKALTHQALDEYQDVLHFKANVLLHDCWATSNDPCDTGCCIAVHCS